MENKTKKNLLMHVCCAPCFIAPYELLQEEGEYEVTGYWFNDNIHPYLEYKRRFDTFLEWSGRAGLSCIVEKDYDVEPFFRRAAGREEERCYFCYLFRLNKAAGMAKEKGFGAFSTTLLYSVYQKHDLIRRIGEEIAQRTGIMFYYRDFRELWKQGVERSRDEKMYRQPYCGCLYSEKDRYYKG